MTSSKKRKTYPNHDVIDQKNPNPKLKFFFYILNCKTTRAFREFEQLSSSICCRVMAGQNLPLEGKSYPFCNFFIFVQKL